MEKSNIVQENRIGVFSVTDNMLFTESESIMQTLFSRVLIVKCEYLYHSCVFEYTAFSNLFEPVVKGNKPLEYNILFTRKDDTALEVKAVKQ